jgi:N-methylhydantoinase A
MQLHSIRVGIDPGQLTEADVHARFLAKYSNLYGAGALLPGVSVRLLSVGVDGIGVIEKAKVPTISGGSQTAAVARKRDVFWSASGAWQPTHIWESESIGLGTEIAGPALIEFPGTTAAVPVGARAAIDQHGNLTIELETRE